MPDLHPLRKMNNFRFILIDSYLSEAQADQVADLSPVDNGNLRFILISFQL